MTIARGQGSDAPPLGAVASGYDTNSMPPDEIPGKALVRQLGAFIARWIAAAVLAGLFLGLVLSLL